MEEMDMRHALLAELIDKMHSRMADKMFPPNPDMASEPAATGIPGSEAATDEAGVESKIHEEGAPEMHGDDKGDDHGIPEDEPTDEEIEEMMK